MKSRGALRIASSFGWLRFPAKRKLKLFFLFVLLEYGIFQNGVLASAAIKILIC